MKYYLRFLQRTNQDTVSPNLPHSPHSFLEHSNIETLSKPTGLASLPALLVDLTVPSGWTVVLDVTLWRYDGELQWRI